MCRKKFPYLNRYIIDGSTLMAFGLAVLSFAYFLYDIERPILAGIMAISSAWFVIWSLYEFIFVGSFSGRHFFEKDNINKHNIGKDTTKQKKKGKTP